MPLTDIAEYGLDWPTWLAWGGLGLMAVAMLLLILIKQPNMAAWVRLLFLRAPTLRGRLLIGFGIVGLIPILTLVPLLGMNSASRMQNEQVAALEGLVQTVADSLPGMVAKRADGVSGLARHIGAIGDFSDDALVDWLLRHHAANTEIVSMWIARPDGDVPVATAVRNGTAERWGGPLAGVGVMDYFQEAVEQGGEYISTVRKGVSVGFSPMVFISEPIAREGEEPWGYLQAQLDLRKVFGHFVMQDAMGGSEVLIVDEQNRVMLASPRLQFRQFENISGHPLFVAMSQASASTSFNFAGSIQANGETGHYVAASHEASRGWRVFAVASQDSTRNLVFMPLMLGVLWAVLALLLARGFAGLLGAAVAQPLKQLDESLDVFDSERTISMIPLAPSDAPAEVQDVYRKVRYSMRKSRDAYRNMMRALNEGAELKRQLREVSGGKLGGTENDSFGVVEGEVEDPTLALADMFAGGEAKDPTLALAEMCTENEVEDPTLALAETCTENEVKDPTLALAETCTENEVKDPTLALAETFAEGEVENSALELVDTYCGRIDTVTELPGQKLFQQFFGDAWELGIVDEKPLSVILLGVGSSNIAALQGIARALGNIGGRQLDFVARIDESQFVAVLPDTDLKGALVVADRMRLSVQGTLVEVGATQTPTVNLGLASIVPNAGGNPQSFVDVVRRVLQAAQKNGNGQIAFISEKGKIHLATNRDVAVADTRAG